MQYSHSTNATQAPLYKQLKTENSLRAESQGCSAFELHTEVDYRIRSHKKNEYQCQRHQKHIKEFYLYHLGSYGNCSEAKSLQLHSRRLSFPQL